MDFNTIVELILGPFGAAVVLVIGNVVLYRELKVCRAELDEQKAARLADLKESEKLATAYLMIRQKENS